ncbi:MAG TPA: sodium:alanine symporter family protein, partial [Candidatus Aminicenantes bacterium]|nr:sodium:alanine symporter family protein [Candidatus Aminicenantes bacterium]
MEQFYIALTQWVTSTADHIWSYMLFVLFAVGAWMTIKTRFIQFFRLKDGMKLIFAGFLGKQKGKKREGDVS